MGSGKNNLILVSFIIFSTSATAQQFLMGKVTKKNSAEVLGGASLKNLTLHKYNLSDMGGNYKIPAIEGDTIIISSAGYLPDTLIVDLSMLGFAFNIQLEPRVVVLQSVSVDEMAGYRQDSIKRREDYGFIYNKKHPIKLWNEKRPGDEPGFSFSPVGFFSKTEKRKRRLKKRLKQEDEEDYIDHKFSRSKVSMLTRLSGDSLQIFMIRYRPSYKFCRNANSQDMLLFINDQLKLYTKN